MPGIITGPGIVSLTGKKAKKSAAPTPKPSAPLNIQSPVSRVTGGQTVQTPEGALTLNVRALQSQLKRDGYDITVDGKMGPQTLSALSDYYKSTAKMSPALQQTMMHTQVTGARDPHAWNLKYGSTKRLTPMLAPTNTNGKAGANTSLDANGNPQYPSSDPTGTVDLSQTQGLDPNTGTPLSLELAKFGTMIDPSTADAMAGQQYDSQIADARAALAKDPTLAKQHTADIGSWYGQVLGSQKNAAARDSNVYTAAGNSLGDAGQALVASLGGGANAGAGDVAAATADAQGTQGALQTAEDQYNNDLRPLLQNEKADMLLNQTNRDTGQQQTDQQAVDNLLGARGQAKTAAQAQIDQENNALSQARASMGVDIRNANNGLAQQGFNNALALAQAQIAAMMSGLQVKTSEAKLGKTLDPNSFQYASPTVKNNAFQQALASLYDPKSGAKLNLTPQQAAARVNGVLSGFGWTPTPGTPSGMFGSNIVRTWQTAG